MNEQSPPLSDGKTSSLAIASLVLGALVPILCIITAIPALITGWIALVRIRKSDGTLKGKSLAIAGLSLGAVGVVLSAVVVACAIMLTRIPSWSTTTDSPTSIEIKAFCQALELYSHDNGAYPTTEQGLQALAARPPNCPKWDGPYVEDGKIKNDAWGHPYVYRCPGVKVPAGFDLLSLGPDGKEGTSDDIGNW